MLEVDINSERFIGNIKKISEIIEIHVDLVENSDGYPTHTHGMWSWFLPELFINASAFGAAGNVLVLNCMAVVMVYELDIVEYPLGVRLWSEKSGDFIVRMVSADFLGVRAAFSGCEEDENSLFAQVYVKGDNYVLEDGFYRRALDRLGKREKGDKING